jgi:hypothetical protein
MTRRMLVVLILLAGPLITGLSQASSRTVETRYLIVSDGGNRLSDDRLQILADQAQTTLERILEFWAADSGIDEFGKIRVIFGTPRKRDYYVSVFRWDRGAARPARAVWVFGSERAPQEMVHKLTTAILFHQDKLIRNMMGIPTEERIGNPLTFPGCGFSSDEWVLSFLKTGSLIPLSELGPDHESWGMKVSGDGFPSVFDRARQTRAYAEAGSFGNYLIRTYGINKMKEFYRLSGRKNRPWRDVFGMTVQELEANWLKSLRSDEAIKNENVAALSRLFETNPNTACLAAERLAVSRR